MMKFFMDEMSYSLDYSLHNCLPLPQCNQHAYIHCLTYMIMNDLYVATLGVTITYRSNQFGLVCGVT